MSIFGLAISSPSRRESSDQSIFEDSYFFGGLHSLEDRVKKIFLGSLVGGLWGLGFFGLVLVGSMFDIALDYIFCSAYSIPFSFPLALKAVLIVCVWFIGLCMLLGAIYGFVHGHYSNGPLSEPIF